MYNKDIKTKEVNKMTIRTNSKKTFEETIKAYRAKGYNIITLGRKMAEMEKDNEVIIITR